MASLRRKPDVVAEAAPETPTMENAEPEVSPATPAPEPELDAAAEALKRQIDALRESENLQQQQQIAMQAANERRQAWLESTPGAKENRDALGRFHHAALTAGLADCSPSYFDFMESQLATLQQPTEAASRMGKEMQERVERSRTPEPPPRSSSVLYSAPVSRDVPTADGPRGNKRVTLTPQEVEMARVSNISVEEYGRQKLKLREMRASGEYSEDQRR